MDLILVKLLALMIGVTIAFLIAKIGIKRNIGKYWSFYFGLLMPIFSLILTLFSKKTQIPRKTTTLIKIFTIFLFLYGLGLIYGGLTTMKYSEKWTNPRIDSLEQKLTQTYPSFPKYNNTITKSIGNVLGCGVLTLIVNPTLLESGDYRTKIFFRLYAGILFISWGFFLIRSYLFRSKETD